MSQKDIAVFLSLFWVLSFVTYAQIIPRLSDSSLYLIDVEPGAYQSLNAYITEHHATSSLKVYVVVAKEISDSEADLYIDRLSSAWQEQNARFAEQDYMIIVLGLNRVIEMKFAGRLDARYGVNGKILLDRYYDSDWLPYARAGDYASGLKNLITRVEDYFKAEEARRAEQARRAEEARRSDEARKSAWQAFQNTILPWLIAGMGVLLFAGLALALRQRHLSAKRQVSELLLQIKEKLNLAQSHLNEFYEKYKLLFEIDGEVIYKNKTFESYQSTSKLVNRLQLGVQLLAQQVMKAEVLIKSEFPIGWAKLEQARSALTKEQVILTTSEVKAGQIKLFSSMTFSLEAQVSELMNSLEQYFSDAQKALDEIWNAILESGPAVAKAQEMNSQIRSQLSLLQEARVALTVYEDRHRTLIVRLTQAEQLLKTDPLSAREQALQTQQELQALQVMLASLLQLAAQRDERCQQLSALRSRIEALRKQGFFLQENGGPDPLCNDAAEGLKALAKAFDEADLDQATGVMSELTELLKFIEIKLTQTVEAKEKIPGEATRLRRRLDELRQLALEVKPSLDALQKEFAFDSYKSESDNIDEVTAALDQCEAEIALALRKADLKCQEYLDAMESLSQVDVAQKQSEALLKAIAVKLQELQNVREQAKIVHEQVTQKRDQLAQFAKEHSSVVSSDSDQRLSESSEMLQSLSQHLTEPKPDWPWILQRLQALSQTLDLASEQAQTEQENFQKLSQLVPEIESKLLITKKFLDEHSEDRAEANENYQKANEFFFDIKTGLGRGKSNWTDLLKKAIRVTELNEMALARAQQDVELYGKAMRELRQAEQEISSGNRSFGYGVSADLQPARQTLNLALSELRAGHYERALGLADEAERTANETVRRAYERARQLEQELVERRRREEMARAAMMAASILFSGGGGSRKHGGGSISFGGGSRGGSSWGSSSGRSGGWSSSSGRRTW
jgi:uncharacterized membrane protein YgcG